MKYTLITGLLLLVSSFELPAQKQGQERIDSLIGQVAKANTDTVKVALYTDICYSYGLVDASKGLPWGMKALELADKIKWDKGRTKANMVLGITSDYLGNFNKAVEYYNVALNIAQKMKDDRMISVSLGNLGISYEKLSDFNKSLDCYFKALRIAEKRKDKNGMAVQYENIAGLYYNLQKSNIASIYYEKAGKLIEEWGNLELLGVHYGNVGENYKALKDYPKALGYYKKANQIQLDLGNQYPASINYLNIGGLYELMGDHRSALSYYEKALKITREIRDLNGTGIILIAMGDSYLNMATDTVHINPENHYVVNREVMVSNAVDYLKDGIAIAQKVNGKDLERKAWERLADAYKAQGNFKLAFEAFRNSKTIGDSIFSMEKQKQIAGLEAKREKELKQKEIEVLAEKNRRQRVVIASTLGGVVMLLVIMGIVAVLLRNKRRAHAILEEKDALIQADLDKAREYILSLLPAEKKEEDLSADWVFIPSSKLGGDAFGYHWIDPDHFAFYILDVCGHGVGPALHAVSVMNFLNSRTQKTLDLINPAGVVSALNEAFQYEQHNGLFFSIWYGIYNRPGSTLTYVCAGHPAPLLVDGTNAARKLGPANVAIGWMPGFMYQPTTVEVDPHTRIILFSDGVYEFDTEDGKSLMLSDFYEFLGNNLNVSLADFHDLLKDHYHTTAFTDDYSMVSIAVK